MLTPKTININLLRYGYLVYRRRSVNRVWVNVSRGKMSNDEWEKNLEILKTIKK